MSSQQIANLHNIIRKMNTEQLINALELNALSDCCEAIRCREIDGDAFLNLTEGQLMFWRNILNRTQITRLWSVVQLAQERPEVFIPADIITRSTKNRTNEEHHSKIDRNIASKISDNLNTLLLQHAKPSNMSNKSLNLQTNPNAYELPPRKPINVPLPPKPTNLNPSIQVSAHRTERNKQINQPLPLKPTSLNPPLQVSTLITETNVLFKPPTEIPFIDVTEINQKLPGPPRLNSPTNRPLPEPEKDILNFPPPISNESTLFNLRRKQEREKSPGQNLNEFSTSSQFKNDAPTLQTKSSVPINPASRPLPELPKEDTSFPPPSVILPKPPPIPKSPAKNQQIHEEEDLAEYDYVDEVLSSYTIEKWFKDVDRKSAIKLLKDKPDGSFLVRPTKAPNICCISVVYQNRVYNLAVSYKDEKVILGQSRFKSVQEMIQHFSRVPLAIARANSDDVYIILRNS